MSQFISSSKSTFMAHLQLSHLHFAPCSHNSQLVQGSSGTFLQWEVGHLQYGVKGLDRQKKPRFVKACIYHGQERLYSAFKCGPHGDGIQSHQSDVRAEEQKIDRKLLQRNGQTCRVLLILAEKAALSYWFGVIKIKRILFTNISTIGRKTTTTTATTKRQWVYGNVTHLDRKQF